MVPNAMDRSSSLTTKAVVVQHLHPGLATVFTGMSIARGTDWPAPLMHGNCTLKFSDVQLNRLKKKKD